MNWPDDVGFLLKNLGGVVLGAAITYLHMKQKAQIDRDVEVERFIRESGIARQRERCDSLEQVIVTLRALRDMYGARVHEEVSQEDPRELELLRREHAARKKELWDVVFVAAEKHRQTVDGPPLADFVDKIRDELHPQRLGVIVIHSDGGKSVFNKWLPLLRRWLELERQQLQSIALKQHERRRLLWWRRSAEDS
jgi:hypothetical protein